MKKTLKYSFVVFAFALGLSTAAYAGPVSSVPKPSPKAAPEVDPTVVVSGLALLGGTLAALRMRRRK